MCLSCKADLVPVGREVIFEPQGRPHVANLLRITALLPGSSPRTSQRKSGPGAKLTLQAHEAAACVTVDG
jgi:hypothetical protein